MALIRSNRKSGDLDNIHSTIKVNVTDTTATTTVPNVSVGDVVMIMAGVTHENITLSDMQLLSYDDGYTFNTYFQLKCILFAKVTGANPSYTPASEAWTSCTKFEI